MSSSTRLTSRDLMNAHTHNGTIKIVAFPPSINNNIIPTNITPMEPALSFISTTNFAYNPKKKKKLQFTFTNSIMRGEFEFHHSYGYIKFKRKNYSCTNTYLINDTNQKINLSYNALAPHNYQHIIFSKNHPMKKIFDTSFHKDRFTGLYHNMYTVIGFAHALSSENILKLFSNAFDSNNEKELSKHRGGALVYGFKDGTFFRVEDQLGVNIHLQEHSLKIEKHKFTNIESIKDLEVNTKRILNEMIDYYRSMNSINDETKIFLAQNLLSKLQGITKIVKYYNIDLGYTDESIAKKVLEPPLKVNSNQTKSPMLKQINSTPNIIKNNSANLILNSGIQEKPASNTTDPRSLEIIKEFRSYSSDLVKMMNRPILVDSSDMRVKDFNLICLKLEDNEKDISYYELLNEWTLLLSYADMQKTTHFNNQQKQNLKDAKTMLNKALHDNSNDNEKAAAVKGILNTLEGLLPVNENTISWLKYETGLKEIEA